jgi:hypothetical protein
MLFLALFLSSLLLLIGNWAAYRSRHPILVTVLSGLGFTVFPLGIGFLSPVVALQGLLLVIAMTVWRFKGWRPGAFLAQSCGATLAAYAIVSWFALQDCARLRGQFPYVSIEDRLGAKAPTDSGPLPAKTVGHLDSLETAIDDGKSFFRAPWSSRADGLQQLHEEAVQVFVNRPGFGVARISGLSEWMLKSGLRATPPVPQPGPRLPPASLAASLESPAVRQEADAWEKDLFGVHRNSVADFVNPGGFGFFKDRRHVAGFQSHQFSEVPRADDPWQLQTLDLVGLLRHDQPVAYISANLPRMDELRDAPTRPLDDFETAGLAALGRGEDLSVRQSAECRRVLGAVRCTKHCLSCHGGERGDLLGAFSYTFTPASRNSVVRRLPHAGPP